MLRRIILLCLIIALTGIGFGVFAARVINERRSEPRGLRMDQAANPDAFIAIMTKLEQNPRLQKLKPHFPRIEEAFLKEEVRWQIAQMVYLSSDWDIAYGFKQVPHEMKKMKRRLDTKLASLESQKKQHRLSRKKGRGQTAKSGVQLFTEETPIKDFLNEQIDLYVEPNHALADACRNAIDPMTEEELSESLVELLQVDEEELMGALEDARDALIAELEL